ncbi:MAG: hypothetical protein EOO09_04860 [Chitinophagaceae bacterium]|nr:MAG: hypothetical protein EOO09_04860 [Chitinophagaceae bacterium]
MKRRNLLSPLVLLSGLFFVVLMASCSKDGSTGADGATGPAGPAGPAGPPGTSNVIYSAWLDVSYKPDTIHLGNGGIDTVGYYAIIDAPKLTTALLASADVKAYINSNTAADPVILALPYSSLNSGLYIQMVAYTQTIELYSNADLSTVSSGGNKYQQYRYMIVPGGTTARSSTAVDWSDYTAVKAYLGLTD